MLLPSTGWLVAVVDRNGARTARPLVVPEETTHEAKPARQAIPDRETSLADTRWMHLLEHMEKTWPGEGGANSSNIVGLPGVPDDALEVPVHPIVSESSCGFESRESFSGGVRVVVDELVSMSAPVAARGSIEEGLTGYGVSSTLLVY